MKKARNVISNEIIKRSRNKDKTRIYVLRLFITGLSPRSRLSIENVRNICERYLRGRYKLEVVDIYQDPEAAKSAQIITAPTLIKKLPLPLRRLVGDMTRTEQVLAGLDIKIEKPAPRRRRSEKQ
jgi:circadian clock protein KaiB